MHDLLRLYAKEIAGDDYVALAGLFDHYLHTADRADRILTPHRFRLPLSGDASAGIVLNDVSSARGWLDGERDNLVACCRVDAPEFDEHRWQLAFVLRGYFYLTKRLDDWLDTHTHALAACQRAGNLAAQGVTRNNLGMALVAAGRFTEAMGHYRRAEELLTAAGDRHGLSNALANQASVLRRWGAHDEALRYQERALAHYRGTGALRNAGITLRSMARVHVAAGHPADAVRCAEEAVDVALGLDQDLDVAQAFNVLGIALDRAGDATLAEIATRQAVEHSRRCGSCHEEARGARHLGGLLAASGRAAEARDWWHAALDCYRELGSAQAEEVRAELATFG
jgi:tetratricopeptide (TPR) repeat protein